MRSTGTSVTVITEPLRAGSGNDDEAWTVGISYNFFGSLLVGAQYIDQKYEVGSRGDVKKKNWHLGADWNFGGPHHIMGAYTQGRRQQG